MSFCTQQIMTLASGVYDEINSPASKSVGYISGVLTSSGFLGEINARLTADFWISGGSCIAGGFGDQEAAIAGLMFQSSYYRQQALAVLQGAAGGIAWTTMVEGDTRITRENPTKLAAEYRALRKESDTELHVLVANWKLGHVAPVSVDAAQMASWPTP